MESSLLSETEKELNHKVAPVRTGGLIAISILAVLCIVLPGFGFSQGMGDTTMMPQSGPVEMANTMRSNGKIYVVVAVLVIILAGLFTYLIRLDRKIVRLEKDNRI